MEYYIDVSNSSQCDVKSIRILCNKNGYSFNPNNKNYYYINTENKQCLGVDSMTKKTIKILTTKCSYKDLKNIFVK